MTAENFIKGQIAAFCYAEAAHAGGYQGMLAIACILRNRRRKGWFGGSWLEIIAHAQESSAHELQAAAGFKLESPDFRRVLQEVDDIYTGTFTDELTAGGLYYLDTLFLDKPGLALRPWFQDKILQQPLNHRRVAQVGMMYIFS